MDLPIGRYRFTTRNRDRLWSVRIFMRYDYLIVGAGLFGSVFAHEAAKRGYKCLVIDRRDHIAGNAYTETVNGIVVHRYGPHIFHTSEEWVWNYVRQYSEFISFVNSPLASYHGELYNLPFNMNTFNKLWGVNTPAEAREMIEEQSRAFRVDHPANLEEQAVSLVGVDIYQKLIKGYSEKQWGRKAVDIPAFVIRRIPIRYTFNNNYYDDPYQGIPAGGYTPLVARLLRGIEVRLNTDMKSIKGGYSSLADKLVYTGMIDEFFGYRFGHLEYRSLRFEHECLELSNFQGNAVINYTDSETSFTRIIEHKHFGSSPGDGTVITREYPVEWKKGDEPYYPVNDEENNLRYMRYQDLAGHYPDIIFGGRLGNYQYYDMDKVIMAAMDVVKREFS